MSICFRKNNLILYLTLIFLLSSCIPAKKVRYLQTEDNESQKLTFVDPASSYKIQKGDNLYIKFTSPEPDINLLLSSDINNNFTQGQVTKYRDVYIVDSKGSINLPQLKPLFVEGYSLEQIKDTLRKSINLYYQNINIDVRLADNYVTILGEVKKPGRYMIDFRDKITIFELIGMAGDLNYEAKRSRVKLIRKENEKLNVYYINLLDIKILENTNYYIYPNDIIYIEPLNAVFWDRKTMPFATTLALILSTTTSILVIISYLK